MLCLVCNLHKIQWLKSQYRGLLWISIFIDVLWKLLLSFVLLYWNWEANKKPRMDESTIVSSKHCPQLKGGRGMLRNNKTLLNWAGLFSFLLEGLFFIKMTSAELTVYTCVSVSLQNVFARWTINDWFFFTCIRLFSSLSPSFLLGWFISVTSKHTSKVQKTLQATDQTGT